MASVWVSSHVPKLRAELPDVRFRALHSLAQRLRAGLLTGDELLSGGGADVCASLSALLVEPSAAAASQREAVEALGALVRARGGAGALTAAGAPFSLSRFIERGASVDADARAAATVLATSIACAGGGLKAVDTLVGAVAKQAVRDVDSASAAPEGGDGDANPWGVGPAAARAARLRIAAQSLTDGIEGVANASAALYAAVTPAPTALPTTMTAPARDAAAAVVSSGVFAFEWVALTRSDEVKLLSVLQRLGAAREDTALKTGGDATAAIDFHCQLLDTVTDVVVKDFPPEVITHRTRVRARVRACNPKAINAPSSHSFVSRPHSQVLFHCPSLLAELSHPLTAAPRGDHQSGDRVAAAAARAAAALFLSARKTLETRARDGVLPGVRSLGAPLSDTVHASAAVAARLVARRASRAAVSAIALGSGRDLSAGSVAASAAV